MSHPPVLPLKRSQKSFYPKQTAIGYQIWSLRINPFLGEASWLPLKVDSLFPSPVDAGFPHHMHPPKRLETQSPQLGNDIAFLCLPKEPEIVIQQRSN